MPVSSLSSTSIPSAYTDSFVMQKLSWVRDKNNEYFIVKKPLLYNPSSFDEAIENTDLFDNLLSVLDDIGSMPSTDSDTPPTVVELGTTTLDIMHHVKYRNIKKKIENLHVFQRLESFITNASLDFFKRMAAIIYLKFESVSSTMSLNKRIFTILKDIFDTYSKKLADLPSHPPLAALPSGYVDRLKTTAKDGGTPVCCVDCPLSAQNDAGVTTAFSSPKDRFDMLKKASDAVYAFVQYHPELIPPLFDLDFFTPVVALLASPDPTLMDPCAELLARACKSGIAVAEEKMLPPEFLPTVCRGLVEQPFRMAKRARCLYAPMQLRIANADNTFFVQAEIDAGVVPLAVAFLHAAVTLGKAGGKGMDRSDRLFLHWMLHPLAYIVHHGVVHPADDGTNRHRAVFEAVKGEEALLLVLKTFGDLALAAVCVCGLLKGKRPHPPERYGAALAAVKEGRWGRSSVATTATAGAKAEAEVEEEAKEEEEEKETKKGTKETKEGVDLDWDVCEHEWKGVVDAEEVLEAWVRGGRKKPAVSLGDFQIGDRKSVV